MRNRNKRRRPVSRHKRKNLSQQGIPRSAPSLEIPPGVDSKENQGLLQGIMNFMRNRALLRKVQQVKK